jgi:hypothetical protein
MLLQEAEGRDAPNTGVFKAERALFHFDFWSLRMPFETSPTANVNAARTTQARTEGSGTTDLGTAVFKRLQTAEAAAGGLKRNAKRELGAMPMPADIKPKTKQGGAQGPVPMPTYLKGIGSLVPKDNIDPGFAKPDKGSFGRNIDPGFAKPERFQRLDPATPSKSQRADRETAPPVWFKPKPGPADTKPSAQPAVPAPNNPNQESRITPLSNLSKLNPKFDLDQARRLTSSSYRMFEAKSSFAEPIANTNGYVATKPISIGGGLSLPVGTKIYSESGLERGPIYDIARPAAINFKLPNGKQLSLQGSFERTSGSPTMKIKFADGKSFEVRGAPFFNPKTGALGRVTPANPVGERQADPSFRLRNTLFDSSTQAAESINGEMNGTEAQKSLADTLR